MLSDIGLKYREDGQTAHQRMYELWEKALAYGTRRLKEYLE